MNLLQKNNCAGWISMMKILPIGVIMNKNFL